MLEYLYKELAWKHTIVREEYYYYEWVIKIHVEGIDPFTDDEYNISRYNEFIIRIKFLPNI